MLPFLKKYRGKNPKIPDRSYSDSMLRGISTKADVLEGVIKAIKNGWRSTSENPEG